MDLPLYFLLRGFIGLLRAFPLTWVARFGRGCGALAHAIDGRHRRVAVKNLTMCLGAEKSPAEIKALVCENFKRIGENFACAVKTSGMNAADLKDHMEVVGADKVLARDVIHGPMSRIFAIGHFGNFELFGSTVTIAPAYRGATTYRAVKGAALNRLLLETRQRSGCLFFERRTEGGALRLAIRTQLLLLGLLSDQHSGDHGVRIPFFGHDASTTKAPAVFALRFNLPLHTAICYRTRPGYWRIEVGDEIPSHESGTPRTVEAMMLDVNRAFEVAVRRDPANWFWVHNRWKPRKSKPSAPVTDPDDMESGGEGDRPRQPERSV
jgi:KDO2-lipid IV(A) lauroyltransferase